MPETSQVQPSAPVPTLFDVIARIESSNWQAALRFEPTIYAKFSNVAYSQVHVDQINAIAKINRCSRQTAEVIFSTSWGATQIMGFNLYGVCDWKAPFISFLNDETAQRVCFNAFCANQKLLFSPQQLADDWTKRELFAKRYNGSINYLGPLCDALRATGFKVVSQAEAVAQK